MRQWRLTDRKDIEPDLEQATVVKNIPAVKDKGGVSHAFIYFFKIEAGIYIPLCHNGNGVATCSCLIGIFDKSYLLLYVRQIGLSIYQCPGIGNHNFGPFFDKPSGHRYRGAFSCITCIGLKGESKETYLLTGQRIEHGAEHIQNEALLLVVIYPYHPFPLVSHLIKTVMPAQIDQIQYILFEA